MAAAVGPVSPDITSAQFPFHVILCWKIRRSETECQTDTHAQKGPLEPPGARGYAIDDEQKAVDEGKSP